MHNSRKECLIIQDIHPPRRGLRRDRELHQEDIGVDFVRFSFYFYFSGFDFFFLFSSVDFPLFVQRVRSFSFF